MGFRTGIVKGFAKSYKSILAKQMEQLVLRQFKKSEKSGSYWFAGGHLEVALADLIFSALCSLTVCTSEHIALLIMADSYLSQIMSICYFLFTCENEVRGCCSGKCPVRQASKIRQQNLKKSEDNKLLKETIEQRETNGAHKAENWDHIKCSAENPLIFTQRSDWNLFLSSNPA